MKRKRESARMIQQERLKEDGDAFDENKNRISQTLAGDVRDIPGSYVDNEDEKIGSEDGQNTYYSLGVIKMTIWKRINPDTNCRVIV
jgi:hypothetical protein